MSIIKTLLLLAIMTALFMLVGYGIGGVTGMVLALGFGGITNLLAWWKSDKMVLRMHKARRIGNGEAPWLSEMVVQLARNAELPTPAVYVINSPQPNAFATGRNPENSAVAMTTGIIRLLSREELAGVIAHELAHIKNRDTLTMTITATLAGAISVIAQIGYFFGNPQNSRFGAFGALLIAILAPMAALVVRMMISRTREYAADRMGAEIAGNPMWLASALHKIGNAAKAMRGAYRHRATAHMFIVNPMIGGGMDSLFSTHPKTANRIEALKEMAIEMGLLPAPQGERIPVRVPTNETPPQHWNDRNARRTPWR